MAFDYVESRADADEAIRDSGGPFALLQYTDDRDSETSEVDRTPTTFNTYALATSYELKEIDGSVILDTDIKFLVSAIQDNGQLMPQPDVGADALFGGTTYEVKSSKPLKLDGATAIYFEVQGRGAPIA